MRVILAEVRGFCAGVVRAIDIVELALKLYGPPVYVKHPIVHNELVVSDLAAKGVITVERVQDIPAGSVAVFSAHGSPPEDYELARDRDIRVIDGACPLVVKVHSEARKYGGDDRDVVIVGHRNHVEVNGTLGHAARYAQHVAVVEPEQEDVSPIVGRAVILTQTTLSQADVFATVRRLTSGGADVVVRDDVCYATSNRQKAVMEMVSRGAQVVLVVGSRTSSNSNRLVEVAIKAGARAYLVSEMVQIDPSWIGVADCIGISSGASTPDRLVKDVVSWMQARYGAVVEHMGTAERVEFVLPRELRGGHDA